MAHTSDALDKTLFAYTFCKITLCGLHPSRLCIRSPCLRSLLSCSFFIAWHTNYPPSFTVSPNVCGTIRNSKFNMVVLRRRYDEPRRGRDIREKLTSPRRTCVILISAWPRDLAEIKADAFSLALYCSLYRYLGLHRARTLSLREKPELKFLPNLLHIYCYAETLSRRQMLPRPGYDVLGERPLKWDFRGAWYFTAILIFTMTTLDTPYQWKRKIN